MTFLLAKVSQKVLNYKSSAEYLRLCSPRTTLIYIIIIMSILLYTHIGTDKRILFKFTDGIGFRVGSQITRPLVLAVGIDFVDAIH